LANKKELEAVIRLAGTITPELKRALHDANKRFNNLGTTSSRVGKLMSSAFSFAAKGAAIGTAAIGAGLFLVAKQGLELASDLREVQNVVDVTFGAGSKQIDAWSKTTLESYGLAELSAKQYSSTYGALMKSSGISSDHLLSMSQNLTALSGDFASFYNLDPAEAFDKIRAGMSGETEPLKQLGIDMSVANLEAFALSRGIKTAYAKMSQGDKTMLRYNYLLQQSGDAQGDFARTQDEYANQMRLFKERFKDMSQTIMTNALPAFTEILNKGNELIKTFMNSPEKIKKMQDAIARASDKAIELIPIAIGYVKDFVGFIGDLYDGAKQAYNFISDNWSKIEPLLYGIVTAMVAWKVLVGGIAIYQGIMTGIAIATELAAAAQWIFNSAVLANPITWIVVGIVAAIAGLIVGIYYLYKNWDTVQAFLVKTWDSVWHAFKVGVNGIVSAINWLIEKMNKIPGVDIPLIPKMDTSAYDAATQALNSGSSSSMGKFARGGFANRASIFGEAGPEAAIPLKRTPRSLSLLSQTASALGVGGGSSGSGANNQFIFSPTYGSGTSESQIKQDFEDFKAMCERWIGDKKREDFGGLVRF